MQGEGAKEREEAGGADVAVGEVEVLEPGGRGREGGGGEGRGEDVDRVEVPGRGGGGGGGGGGEGGGGGGGEGGGRREGGREGGLAAGKSDEGLSEQVGALIAQRVVRKAENAEGGKTGELRVDETFLGGGGRAGRQEGGTSE